MPSGQKPGYVPHAAIAAAARAKHETMLWRIEQGWKRCPRCLRTLAIGAFALNRSAPDNRHGWCRGCRNASQRQRAQERRDAEREAQRQGAAAETTKQQAAAAAAAGARQKRAAAAAAAEARAATLRYEAAMAARSQARTEAKRRQPHVWRLRCCGGELVNDRELHWWVAVHVSGCRDRWQPRVPGKRTKVTAGNAREVTE
jgi:hypothetical protein